MDQDENARPDAPAFEWDTAPDLPVGVSCWRCGLLVPAEAPVCPHCAARPKSVNPSTEQRSRSDPMRALFWSYALLLTTGVVHALVLGFWAENIDDFDADDQASLLQQVLIVEVIDTVIVATAFLICWPRRPVTLPAPHLRIATWFASVPLLATILALNFGYHWLLRTLLQVPLISDELMQQFTWLAFLVVCVQPAFVEEAYNRRFVLDNLLPVTGKHSAVWISATMFGMMHVAVLPSIPYLIAFGAFLGYMRLASGTIWLPILLHFVHNLVIFWFEN